MGHNSFARMQFAIAAYREREKIIAAFLDLGPEHDWPEGSTLILGQAFVRTLFLDMLGSYPSLLTANRAALDRVKIGYQNYSTPSFGASCGRTNPYADWHPTQTRVCYDPFIRGWSGHALARLVGNLSENYTPSAPFFEIIINSQVINQATECNPFSISIYNSEEELNERRRQLVDLESVSDEEAYPVYYDQSLISPSQWKGNPEHKRILEALIFMQDIRLPTQTVGNCWFKQPMRALLGCLYLEIYSQRRELSPQEAWKEARAIYQLVRITGLNRIARLSKKTQMSPSMHAHLLAAIKKFKN